MFCVFHLADFQSATQTYGLPVHSGLVLCISKIAILLNSESIIF